MASIVENISVEGAMDMVVEEEEETDQYILQFDTLEASIDDISEKAPGYKALIADSRTDEKALKIKEQCIYRLVKFDAESRRFDDVLATLKGNDGFFGAIPKAKTAKIVRNILAIVEAVPDSLDVQISLCKDVVMWCEAEKRTFLRQRIEAKLASLLLKKQQPTEALVIVDNLMKELKKLDDKQMLTEVHLTEARIYHALQNIPKSKASLTASRTAANSIYVVPLLQAEIDEMSGTLMCEEGDYTTAASYFLEAFEAYDQSKSPSAVSVLKYLVLSKVLNNQAADVPAVLTSKIGVKHTGVHLDAMAAVARAAKAGSLNDFNQSVTKYEQYLKNDPLISHHLELLYDKMMEANLLKILSPFSCVEIDHVAMLIGLPETTVIRKLSQMILDKKFWGILDQGRGHLIIYESAQEDSNFARGAEIISNMDGVVDALFGRAKGLLVNPSSATAIGSATSTATSSAAKETK